PGERTEEVPAHFYLINQTVSAIHSDVDDKSALKRSIWAKPRGLTHPNPFSYGWTVIKDGSTCITP
ncbi:hypothetical protein HAX54_039304, partial [Datura stramonium]|nr:hypothetical protein [Datura stramonium]